MADGADAVDGGAGLAGGGLGCVLTVCEVVSGIPGSGISTSGTGVSGANFAVT